MATTSDCHCMCTENVYKICVESAAIEHSHEGPELGCSISSLFSDTTQGMKPETYRISTVYLVAIRSTCSAF